ncbi:hypothetical protein LWI28_010472 [Acer negundo]|uniref:Retrovirus-related Pol polyprotein from transposon TNT 1-94-like beta-barrel domain-containing protein n=1 Tax=Acer negundo TaxID=4023 RepID=A0AAD5IE65_ACENE|nr:hypothetical protein LWI28_010472 [Acer negundo]
MFSELDETFASEVKFGNNSKVSVMGKGKISISLNDGSKNTISEGCWDWSCDKGSSSDIDVDLDEIDGHPRDDPVSTSWLHRP